MSNEDRHEGHANVARLPGRSLAPKARNAQLSFRGHAAEAASCTGRTRQPRRPGGTDRRNCSCSRRRRARARRGRRGSRSRSSRSEAATARRCAAALEKAGCTLLEKPPVACRRPLGHDAVGDVAASGTRSRRRRARTTRSRRSTGCVHRAVYQAQLVHNLEHGGDLHAVRARTSRRRRSTQLKAFYRRPHRAARSSRRMPSLGDKIALGAWVDEGPVTTRRRARPTSRSARRSTRTRSRRSSTRTSSRARSGSPPDSLLPGRN